MAGDDFTLALPRAGPQCIDCGQPVQRRPGAAAPKRCPEHARERARERKRTPEYRERERELKRNPEYRERERERRRNPEYRERNRDRMRERKRNAKVGRTRKLLVRLIVRQRALCALCGNLLPEDAHDIHVDHIVPVAKGAGGNPQ